MDTDAMICQVQRLGTWQTRFHVNGETFGGGFEVRPDDLLIREFVNRIDAPRSRVLELGCMEGGRTFPLAGKVAHVTAIDARREHLERARFVQSLMKADNISFLQGNLETFDFRTIGRFDAIYNVGLLYHLPQPWVLMRRLVSVAPCMYLWTHLPAGDIETVVRGGYRGVLHREQEGDHVGGVSPRSFRPTFDELQRMLDRCGWEHEVLKRDGSGVRIWCVSKKFTPRWRPPEPRRFRNVAVIVTCHNYGHFLGECLQSIVDQAYPAAEVVVVDDASDDQTEHVAKRFEERGVRYLRVEHRNVHLARKAGVEATTSELLLFVDADNTLSHDYLECGVPHFAERNVGVVYADMNQFGLVNQRVRFPDTYSRAELFRTNFVDACSLIRRDALEVSDVWNWVPDRNEIPEDLYMFQQIAKSGWQFRKQSSVVNYRTHDNQRHRLVMESRAKVGYWVHQGINRQDITLFIPLAGRPKAWQEMSAFLERQTYPHYQIRLILCDTSQDLEFTKQVREWIAHTSYGNVHHFLFAPARPGLADEDRRNEAVESEVQLAMCRIYNRLRESVETDYCWVLEDDIIPPDDALQRLLRHFERDVGSVHAPYPSRWDPDYVVWDYKRSNSPGVHRVAKPSVDENPVQLIRGSGFGCIVFRSHLLRDHVFSIPAGERYYDPHFFEMMGDRWKRICDWSCECKHVA